MKSGLTVVDGAPPDWRPARMRFPDELELISQQIEVLDRRLLLLRLGLWRPPEQYI
jgi:hypothetical protein